MKITVFTPTYNRAYIIERLYESLYRQTYHDFEWLVVDDGSSDDTEMLFRKFQNECKTFSIRYYKKENGGKCRAINYALDLAEGDLFFTVDSDDYLTNDALEKLAEWENQLPKNQKFCGIAGNLGISETETVNRAFDNEYFEGTLLDRHSIVNGERAIAIYTDVHRKYRYPEFEGEKFMTEAVIWNRMANDGYRMRFFNDIIWIYEYRDDGLTKQGNTLFLNNPRGYGLWLKEKAEFEKKSLKEKMKMYYTFTCDLSEKYENKIIAESIGAPLFLIVIIRILHNCKVFLHRKKKENDKEDY